MEVHEKAALLIPSGPSHDPNRKHLHIVCVDPDENGDVVIVSISTYTSALCDGTCILQANDHPWLRHESYVLYRSAEIVPAERLAERIIDGSVSIQVDLNAQAFLRVRNGLCASPHTKRKIKRFLDC